MISQRGANVTIVGTIMYIDDKYNGSLEPYYKMMKYVLTLCFGSSRFSTFLSVFNQPFEIGPRIKNIYFNSLFDSHIKLTKCMKVLIFGCQFNKPIELSKNMIYLKFGERFNKPIVLSKNLKHLIFETYFNKTLYLPKRIKRLTISFCYADYCVTDCVTNTKNLQLVILCNNPKINDNLPNGLINVYWGKCNKSSDNLPNDLKR